MLDEICLDQRIWKPMLNSITHLRRFNMVAGTMSSTWTRTTSIIQGCSLSLLATVALSTAWARALDAEIPAVLCNSIVDDRRLCVTGKSAPKQLQAAIQLTRDIDTATVTRFNPRKSTDARHPNQTHGESGATNFDPVWNQGGELRETKQVGYPSRTKETKTETTKTSERMQQRGQSQESRACPLATALMHVRDSSRRTPSQSTNSRSIADCRANNLWVASRHISCTPCGQREQT